MPEIQRWQASGSDSGNGMVAGVGGVYNLGSGASRPIRDIAALVRQAVACRLPRAIAGGRLEPPPLRLGAVPYREDQVMLLEADIGKLTGATGWKPAVTLEDGIERTVAAYVARIEQERRLTVKRTIVTMAYRSQSSHVGAALSVADILLALYFHVLRVDAARPDDPRRDKLVFSKAHASTALYAALAERGFFSRQVLEGYAIDGGRLPGHLDRKSVPGIDASAGSLGHGLSIGAGFALADRLAGRDSRTFVVLGDGECNEGAIWEAALVASSQQLRGLRVIVDCNGWQGFGRTDELSPLAALSDKWRAFGWEVVETDGHDLTKLTAALDAPSLSGKPAAVLARTVKGFGVDFMADTLEWHYKSPSKAQWEAALLQLGGKGEAE